MFKVFTRAVNVSTSGEEGLPTKVTGRKRKQDICEDNSSTTDSVGGVVITVRRAQNHSGLTVNTAWVCCLHMFDAICIGQGATKLPVLFQPYLLQVVYVTFQYLTVSCIPADISIPDSFMYTCYRSLCDISIPDSFMYTCYRSLCDISIHDNCMYTCYRSCIYYISIHDNCMYTCYQLCT